MTLVAAEMTMWPLHQSLGVNYREMALSAWSQYQKHPRKRVIIPEMSVSSLEDVFNLWNL